MKRLALPVTLTLSALALPAIGGAQTLEEDSAAATGTPAATTTTPATTTPATTTPRTTTTAADAPADGASEDAPAPVNAELNDEQSLLDDAAASERIDPTDPRERPDTDYLFAGVLGRGMIVPEFIQAVLVDIEGGQGANTSPLNAGFGAFFTYRRNNFNVTLEASYLTMNASAYYHGLGAADSEFEYIESGLAMIQGNILFGWSFPVTEWFAIEIGFGLGFGGLIGDLYRTEAYRAGAELRPCEGPGLPDSSGFCEPGLEVRDVNGRIPDNQPGGTYQRYTGSGATPANNGPNPHYFGGGGIPPMFFWLDLPRVGVRFKPIRQIQIRIDGGYNLYGFNFGGSIGYGF